MDRVLSLFPFCLPRKVDGTPFMITASDPTILLVDDDLSVVAMLQHALAQAGYQVIVASDAMEALQRHEAERGAVDLLITDLQMPQMSGQELARGLRKQRSDLPILFISGNPDAEAILRAEAFPKSKFLAKPFMPSELLALLPELLNG